MRRARSCGGVFLGVVMLAVFCFEVSAKGFYRRPAYRPYYSPRAAMQMQQQQQRQQQNVNTNQPPQTNVIQRPLPLYYARPQPKPDPEKIEAEKKRLERNTVNWLKIRAEEGSTSAQYSLGVRYLTGDGVEKNPQMGRSLLQKAADAGEDRAKRKLEQLDRAPKVEPEPKPEAEPKKEEPGQQ
jgi:TPR repeat protein